MLPDSDDAQLDIQLLGPLQVSLRGQPVALPSSRKARALLAYLAATRRAIRRDELCRLLFADTDDPRASLRWAVSRLRASLGADAAQMLPSGGTALLLEGTVSTDLQRLERLLATASEPGLDELRAAEAAVAGNFLEGLELDGQPAFEAWRLAERVRCLDLHSDLLRRIIQKLDATKEAVDYARKLVALDAADESAWATLVETLVAVGKSDDARRVFDRARRELTREGMPHGDLLADALRSPPVKASARTQQRTSDRPTLAVVSCSVGSGIQATWGGDLTAALTAAAARNALCRVLVSCGHDNGLAADLELHSHLHRVGHDFELRVQLVSAPDGDSVFSWTPRLQAESPAALAESVFAYFASHLEVDLAIALIALARDKPREALTPRDRFLLALPLIYSTEGMRITDALRELESVVAQDARLGVALCATAWVRTSHPEFNSNPAEVATTSRLARRAVELSLDDPFVLGWAAMVITHTDLDPEMGTDLAQRALRLNPHSPMGLLAAAWTEHFRGEHRRSLEFMDRLDALDAAGPMTFIAYTCRAMSCYQLGRFEDSLYWCRRAAGHNATFIVTLRILAASLVRLGRLDEARRVAEQMVEIDASENLAFFEARLPYRRTADRKRLLADLAAAGLPETG